MSEADSQRVETVAAAETIRAIVDNLGRVVHAPDETLRLCVLCLVGEGHLILEDFPGVGKTMLAKALARSLDVSFSRMQFTPDLLPSDVTGVNVFNQRSNEFEFRPGPVFANLLLVDEINRASPKTQAALLECMQEQQVTTDGVTNELDRPFMVMATQNPIEYEGTYPLPEAQLDRFTMRIAIGYPPLADRDPHREAVELCFGKRVRALVLDRVLGRHHHEGAVELVRHAVGGDLLLLHALEQGRLGLRRSPVDFVDEQQVGEDGAWPKLELVGALVEDVHAGHVRGQQIRRELHPGERHVQRACECLREHRLAHSREVLEDQVALADEAEHAEPERLVGRVHHTSEVVDDRADRFRRGHRLDSLAIGLAHATAPQPYLRSPPRSGL